MYLPPILLALVSSSCLMAMEVDLAPSYLGPGAVGNLVTWVATVHEAAPGTLWYRFRSRAPFGEYRVIRDFGPNSTMDFAAIDHEGTYEMEVIARNRDTGEIVSAVNTFEFLARTVDTPVVNPTAHPLMFLFTAPLCAEGYEMRVEFRTALEPWVTTPAKPCDGARTMNFLLAGLRAETAYVAHATLTNEGKTVDRGPDLPFETASVADFHPAPSLLSSGRLPAVNTVLLNSDGSAIDLAGNQVWFNPNPLNNITRTEAGGYFWGYVQDPGADTSYQMIRKVDLLGQTVLETNAARVNEQLAALGKRPITSFHHEVRPISGGRILALATVEQFMNNVQGPGEVNVLGDMIVVLDQDLNVIWTWDAFDWLNPAQRAVLDETCLPTGGGCPPFYNTARANDWTHSNSLQLTPDGHLLVSVRHLDWVLKLDFADGQGDGHIIWRLGYNGDFRLDGADPNLWFSHQHDANVELPDPTRLIVYDNGNTRVAKNGPGQSRGQVWKLDESNMTARPVLNANLGVYAPAVGSAQMLSNGNYHFHSGFVFSGPRQTALTVETNRAGVPVYSLQADRLIYRTFRLADLYSAE